MGGDGWFVSGLGARLGWVEHICMGAVDLSWMCSRCGGDAFSSCWRRRMDREGHPRARLKGVLGQKCRYFRFSFVLFFSFLLLFFLI